MSESAFSASDKFELLVSCGTPPVDSMCSALALPGFWACAPSKRDSVPSVFAMLASPPSDKAQPASSRHERTPVSYTHLNHFLFIEQIIKALYYTLTAYAVQYTAAPKPPVYKVRRLAGTKGGVNLSVRFADSFFHREAFSETVSVT